MGNCGCIGARPFIEELKLWIPLIVVSGIAVGVPIGVGADLFGTLIGYGSFCLFMILIGLMSNCFFNYGCIPAYVKSDKTLKGYTAIVTGANSGSGYYTAKHLVERGCNVIITCRSEKKATTTIDNIGSSLSTKLSECGSLDYVLMDLCSKQSVDKAVESILSKNVEISIIVNNAGAILTGANITSDGVLAMWQANYLSPFYFTKKLLDNVKSTAQKHKYGRIVNVASIAHMSATEKIMDGFISSETRGDKSFWESVGNSYGDTKLAQILYTQKLQELLDEEKDNNGESIGSYLKVFSLQPGFINSNFYAGDNGIAARIMWLLVYPFMATFGMVTPNQGAQTSLHCVLSDDNIKPGGYHGHCSPQPLKSAVVDLAVKKKDILYTTTDQIWSD